MNRNTVVGRWIILACAFVLIGVSGCSGKVVIGTPQALPTKTLVVATVVPQPVAAGDHKLTPAKFEQVIKVDAPTGGAMFVSTGLFQNQTDQTFIITVTGRTEEAVTTYIDKTLFYLEASVSPISVNKDQVENIKLDVSGKSLLDTDLADPNTESLIIEMDLAPEYAAEHFKDGYDLAFQIDPTVARGYTHHYSARHVSPSLSTRLSASFGSVTGNLYRNCISTGATPISAGATRDLPLSTSGYAWYDLAVTGNNSGSNTYSIVQGLWSNWSYYITSIYSSWFYVTCW